MSAISVRYTIVLQTTESHAYGQKGLTLWVYWLSFVVSLQLDISFHIVPADCRSIYTQADIITLAVPMDLLPDT